MPRSTASPATISVARSDFFFQLNLHFERVGGKAPVNLRVGQVVPGSVTLVEIPRRLAEVWIEAPRYLVLSTKNSILLVERQTRKVAFIVNRDTYFIITPDPNVRIMLDAPSNRFCVVDVKAGHRWNVQFAYDSDRLLPGARYDLEQMLGSLRSRDLNEIRFIVVGHTDAIGTPEYNYDLSRRRAKSVVDHLVWVESVSSEKVKWFGRGFDELLIPAEPRNPRNRRVQLHPILAC